LPVRLFFSLRGRRYIVATSVRAWNKKPSKNNSPPAKGEYGEAGRGLPANVAQASRLK